jgi:ABC-type transport system involved in cytochrome bd biosynthesis fused ATPase/permease subunit
VLRADELAVGWPDGPVLAAGLNLRLRPGERVALIGPSGIGKSTVAATIMGAPAPRSGRVSVEGRIGYLAQEAYVFDSTVAENVRIGGPEADDDQVRRSLRAVGLEFPLDRMVGEYGRSVSGGEARRLALARLDLDRRLHGDHAVLVLDEPTEHLDRQTADQILDLVFGMQGDSAVLVITHDPAVMARCDRIVDLGSHSAR